MSLSPTKRRKTSPTTSIAIDASHNADAPPSNAAAGPPIPMRASFQSPTKASLARFNPRLLPPQTTDRVTRSGGSRPETLVQQVLGNKRRSSAVLERVSQDATSKLHTPVAGAGESRPPATAAPDSAAAPESLSTAIARVFNESRPVISERSPLRPRQPSVPQLTQNGGVYDTDMEKVDYVSAPRTQGQRARNKPMATVTRREIQANDDFFETGPSSDDTGEPDLPPTPTQLGISPQPDRPRGLSLSSSPSGRRERRLAKETGDGHSYKSSPLKPRAEPLEIASGVRDEEGPESGTIEADEILADQAIHTTEDDAEDELLQEKREVKRTLTSQLRRLQSELKQIESLVDTTNNNNSASDLEIDDTLFNLLISENPSCLPPFAATNAKLESSPPEPKLIRPSDATSLQYLNLFSPGNLNLSTISSTPFNSPTNDKDLLQRHALVLTPPAPFPAHILRLALQVETSITHEQILNVTVLPQTRMKGHNTLQHWIESRLADDSDEKPGPHARDVGTLVWGVGTWWTAVVERARIWHALKHGTPDPGSSINYNAVVTKEEMKALLPYLSKQSATYTDTSKGGAARALHLTYTFEIDWTGEPVPQISVCGSGLPDTVAGGKGENVRGTVELDLKDVFEKMRSRMGVVEAVRGVRGVLFGGGES